MNLRYKYPNGDRVNYHYALALKFTVIFVSYVIKEHYDVSSSTKFWANVLIIIMFLEALVIIVRELVRPTDYWREKTKDKNTPTK